MKFTKTRAFSVIYMAFIGAAFAAVLSAVKVGTAPQIADNKRLTASRDLVRVFDLMEITPKTTGKQLTDALAKSVREYWIVGSGGARKIVDEKPADGGYRFWVQVDGDGAARAYAFEIGGMGFWGPIRGILSVETDGVTIKNVVWTGHGETPGLGARIEEDGFRAEFKGKLASDPAEARFQVVPEGTSSGPHQIDQITGATQTTVVGLGQFLNDNFAAWHDVWPRIEERFGGGRNASAGAAG